MIRTILPSTRLLFLVLLVGYLFSSCHSLVVLNRRKLLLAAASASATTAMAIAACPQVLVPVVNAACMPGDLSPECIGVYKTPLEYKPRSASEFNALAPDVTYIAPLEGPSTTAQALATLKTQRQASEEIRGLVASGRLEEAGIQVLKLIPQWSLAGQRLVEEFRESMETASSNTSTSSSAQKIAELRYAKLLDLFQTSEVAWKSIDVLLGQGLRGDLGVSAVAQLQILDEVRQAQADMDDFVAAVANATK